jgi:hypothetical protein
MKRMKQRETDECPWCNQPEDAQRVWMCKSRGLDSIWEKSLYSVQEWMRLVDTEIDIQNSILQHLRACRDGGPAPEFTPPRLRTAVLD